MIVSQFKLAAIFGVRRETIAEWQLDGCPYTPRVGVGEEHRFNSARCIAWNLLRELERRGIISRECRLAINRLAPDAVVPDA